MMRARVDGRTSGQSVDEGGKVADNRMSGRGGKGADDAHERTVGRTGAERVRTVEWRSGRGPRSADGAQHARTGGRADERTSSRADERTGRSGSLGGLRGLGGSGGRAVRRSGGRVDGRTSGWAWV